MRQLRIEEGGKINKRLVETYVVETIANHYAGEKVAPAKKTLKIPAELDAALEKDSKLKVAFNTLTRLASSANMRITRMGKAGPLIFQGVGLHDKYKNC